MARAYTIYFSFRGRSCTAVIYMLSTKITVYLADERLHDIIPGGRFELDLHSGFRADGTLTGTARELIEAITQLIEEKGSRPADQDGRQNHQGQ